MNCRSGPVFRQWQLGEYNRFPFLFSTQDQLEADTQHIKMVVLESRELSDSSKLKHPLTSSAKHTQSGMPIFLFDNESD